jgi:hypothetical protein
MRGGHGYARCGGCQFGADDLQESADAAGALLAGDPVRLIEVGVDDPGVRQTVTDGRL